VFKDAPVPHLVNRLGQVPQLRRNPFTFVTELVQKWSQSRYRGLRCDKHCPVFTGDGQFSSF